MREITKQMIQDFNLKKLGYDMMGYEFINPNQLSFHHLIVPRRNCKALGLGEGYLYWNGSILRQNTSHDYLHLVESKDYDRFLYITSELIDINVKRAVLYENIRRIHDCLCGFEKEHCSDKNKNGYLIKEEYTRRLIKR